MKRRVGKMLGLATSAGLALIAITGGVACTPEQSAESAAPTQVSSPALPGAPTANPRSTFLWHASMDGEPGDLWLLGSVHVRSRENASLDRAVTDALARSERVVFEANFEEPRTNEAAQFTVEHGLLPQGQTLSDRLPPELYASWKETIVDSGLATTVYERMQPWLAAYSLQIAYLDKAGYAWDAGVDHTVYALAKREPGRQREIIGLETSIEQLKMLRQSSAEVQEAMIRDSIRSIRTGETQKLLELYVEGDEPGLEAFVASARRENPALAPFWQGLLDQRNERMVERLLPYFEQPGSTFVTVGAAHLYGKDGLLQQFESTGAHVEAVAPLGPAPRDLLSFATVEARPSNERFASTEDGFSVVMGAPPVVQSLEPRPSTRVNSYTVGVGIRSALVVTVAPLPRGADDRALASFARSALQAAGITPNPPEATELAGEPAVSVRGSTNGASGEATAARRGDRVYVVSGLATSGDEDDRAALSRRYRRMRESFRWED